MSKNITDAALEGRTSRNAFERRETKRVERMSARAALRKINVDPSLADELPLPERDGVYRDFACRMVPASRWLARKAIGFTVEEVRGLLMRSFDTRSFAGHHIVFDHLMPRNYRGRWQTQATNCEFDAHGVLVRCGRGIRRPPRLAPKKLRIRARQWLATLAPTERIGMLNGAATLFTATDHCHFVRCTDRWCLNCTTAYRMVDGRYQHVRVTHPKWALDGLNEVPVHFVRKYRPVRPLTADETSLWRALRHHNHDLERNP